MYKIKAASGIRTDHSNTKIDCLTATANLCGSIFDRPPLAEFGGVAPSFAGDAELSCGAWARYRRGAVEVLVAVGIAGFPQGILKLNMS